MDEFLFCQPHASKKTEDKEKERREPRVVKPKKEDPHQRILKRISHAKHIRTQNEASEGLVSLNKKIFFVNNNLVELYKRDTELYGSNDLYSFSIDGEEDSIAGAEDECKAKLLVACRLTRAYNILEQKGGEINPLVLKKICQKRMSQTNTILSPEEVGSVLVKHKLRLCVKALYVAARMRRSKLRQKIDLSLDHCYADEHGVLRRLRLTEKLAGDLISTYQNESWQPDVSDSTPPVRHFPVTTKPSRLTCHRHRTFPCSYSTLLRKLCKALAHGDPEETMAGATAESDLPRGMYDFGEEDARFEMLEECEEVKSYLHEFFNGPKIPVENENEVEHSEMDEKTENNEEDFAEMFDENLNSEETVKEVDFVAQAENIRMGDVFWVSAEYDPPFEGAPVFDKWGRARPMSSASCLVVVFAALRHAQHPLILAIDRYFEKYPCLREGAELLTVCPEGGLLEQALLVVQRSRCGSYASHRGHLACSLMLRCRPRRLPAFVALDVAGRLSSTDALSDLMALGPEHALVKWSGRPPLIPAPTVLGFAEFSTDDLVSCHLRPACFSRTCPLPAWRPILADRTVFQPASPAP